MLWGRYVAAHPNAKEHLWEPRTAPGYGHMLASLCNRELHRRDEVRESGGHENPCSLCAKRAREEGDSR